MCLWLLLMQAALTPVQVRNIIIMNLEQCMCIQFMLYVIGSSSQYSEVELRSYFPFISDEEALPHYRMKLLNRTESIQQKFASLVLDVQKALVKNQWKLEDIVSIITVHYGNSDEINTLLNGSESIAEILGRLSKYFSFYNYSIIKMLVHKLNSTAITKKLMKYKKAFREYSKLRICECPAGAFGSCEDDEKVYVLITEMKLNDSLAEYEKLQFEMNKVLGGKLLRLVNVEEVCGQLTFGGTYGSYVCTCMHVFANTEA